MGAANLSHSTATFATIRNRMRRLQNTKAGPQGPASLSIGRNHLFHSAVTPATLRLHKPRTSGTVTFTTTCCRARRYACHLTVAWGYEWRRSPQKDRATGLL